MKKLLMLLLLAYFMASCASYTPQPVTLLRVQSAAVSAEEQGIAAGVTPYLDSERNQQLFNADLKRAGILPLQLVIRNKLRQRVTIKKKDMVLKLSGGHEYSPAPSRSVAARLESNAGVIGWTVAFGIVGYLASESQQQEVNKTRRADLSSKEFSDTTLGYRESARGFVFFLVPDDVKEVRGATLFVEAVDVSTGKRTSLSLSLPAMEEWHAREEPDER